MDEEQLISLLKKRDESAFRWLVEQWQNMVYNTALGMLQNEEDAEDTAQEVFVQVYESIGSFKEQSKISTWVYRITIRKCLDALRHKKRKKRFGILKSLYGPTGDVVYEPPEFVHPGVLSERKEDAALLFKALERIPDKQKSAFVLNKIEMLSYREVAEILQLSVNAVDSLLQRAKKNLKTELLKMEI